MKIRHWSSLGLTGLLLLTAGQTLASDPDCDEGNLQSNGWVCCDSRCGQCGVSGCSSSDIGPGAAFCCSGTIQKERGSCDSSNPPCLVTMPFEELRAVPTDPILSVIHTKLQQCLMIRGNCRDSTWPDKTVFHAWSNLSCQEMGFTRRLSDPEPGSTCLVHFALD